MYLCVHPDLAPRLLLVSALGKCPHRHHPRGLHHHDRFLADQEGRRDCWLRLQLLAGCAGHAHSVLAPLESCSARLLQSKNCGSPLEEIGRPPRVGQQCDGGHTYAEAFRAQAVHQPVGQGWTGPQILTGVPRQGTKFHRGYAPGKILRILALAEAPPARVCRLPGWL